MKLCIPSSSRTPWKCKGFLLHKKCKSLFLSITLLVPIPAQRDLKNSADFGGMGRWMAEF